MSSMHRAIEGDVLVNHLTRDEWLIDQDILAKHGRTARTLVKEGPLRLTVMAIGPGGNLPPHDTTGPVTIQVLEGELLFTALDREYPLKTGDVLVLAPGVEHSATSEVGGKFLLTVFHAPSAGSRLPAE
ncbi:MAG TPA: cupin domain-containing protein [Gemmatimonadaceae bacterium]|nr:cupin domain-containing protein [Gemmatimonadaceae bacterium]